MLNGLTAWHSKNVAEVANGQVKEQDTIKSLNNQTFSWFHVKVGLPPSLLANCLITTQKGYHRGRHGLLLRRL